MDDYSVADALIGDVVRCSLDGAVAICCSTRDGGWWVGPAHKEIPYRSYSSGQIHVGRPTLVFRTSTGTSISQLRGDVNHLVNPIIGAARLESVNLDLGWLIQRLYVLLDLLENAVGNAAHQDSIDNMVEAYRRHGMPQRRAEGIAAVEAQQRAAGDDT